MVGEFGFNKVWDMPSKDELRFDGPGTYTSGNPIMSLPGGAHAGKPYEQPEHFADDFSTGYRLATRFDYNNAIGAWSLSPRLAWAHDPYGNTPGPGGSFLEGQHGSDRRYPGLTTRTPGRSTSATPPSWARAAGTSSTTAISSAVLSSSRSRGRERNMRMNPKIILGLALVFAVCSTATVWAGLSPEEIAKLGNELTPMGAEKAGNADGTIPAWTGGTHQVSRRLQRRANTMSTRTPAMRAKFTITAANMSTATPTSSHRGNRRCSRPIPTPTK